MTAEPLLTLAAALLAKHRLDAVLNLQFDVMVKIAGIRSFEGLRSRATNVEFGGNPLKVAALDDVIRSKEAADRLEDRAVLPVLRGTVRERARVHYRPRGRRA